MNDILSKLNANEKMVGIGSIIVIASFILGIFTLRFVGFLQLPCGVLSIVVLFLKYSPDAKFEWPVPVPLILVILGGIATVFAALGVLFGIPFFLLDTLINASGMNIFLGLIGLVLSIAILVGSGMMLLGGYKEYQVKPA